MVHPHLEEADQRLIAAAVLVWSTHGRTGTALDEDCYAELYRACWACTEMRFLKSTESTGEVRFSEEDIFIIVERCLLYFLTPLYTRHFLPETINPEDIVKMLANAALDHHLERGGPSVEHILTSESDDDELVASVFGQEFVAQDYRNALRSLRLAGARVPYMVITHYMDMVARAGSRSVRYAEVADVLNATPKGFDATEASVSTAMIQFSIRLAQVKAAKPHA